ncbi:MAG TPA: hypothetical protein VGM69_16710 [Chloroflexota bacterium]
MPGWASVLEPARGAPRRLGAGQILELQRAVGNQGVGRLIQRNLYPCYASWNAVKSKKQAIDTQIAGLLRDFRDAFIKDDYYALLSSLDKLEPLVQQRLGTSTDQKKLQVLQLIAQEIQNERAALAEPMSSDAIADYMKQNEVYKWSLENELDLSKDLIELRRKLIRNELNFKLKPTTKDVDDKARQAAALGTMKGYWVGRGLCDLAVIARGGTLQSGFEPNGVIKWNHYIMPLGGERWDDPTYRQFFAEGDWAGGPAMFQGDADAFRALGLNKDRTEYYLEFIGRA